MEEAGESGSPAMRPEAAGVRVPATSRSGEELLGLLERHGDMIATASPADSPPPPFPALRTGARQVSISLPASPTVFDVARTEAEFPQHSAAAATDWSRVLELTPRPAAMTVAMEHNDLPSPRSCEVHDDDEPSRGSSARMAMSKAPRDTSYDSFKTWSGKLEKQLTTHLRGVMPAAKQQEGEPEEDEDDDDAATISRPHAALPRVQRFFAALEGPELDKLRSSEELVLPSDKTWPFLLRFPVSAFGMCLGMSSQAILWKRIATSASTRFLHVTARTNLALWAVSVALMGVVSALYACKVVFYFEAVRREYYHPVRVNFFFAPWIACLFLAIGVPELVAARLPRWLWYVLMAPILCLELKIYGQWISGGQRRLSRVANPSNHLAVVGNFVGALLGAIMGLREGPVFFFAVGLAHYTVLFVTLYQRLPTSETLPRDLHPIFFLFVAAPSVAGLAWERITGEFGYGSRVAFFIAMFLYASLVLRINLFKGVRFSLAWWAYTFPMTSAATAAIRYSSEVKNALTQSVCVALTVAATLTVAALFLTTLLHAAVLRDLFPNDISIAITERRPKPTATAMDDLQHAARDLEAAAAEPAHQNKFCGSYLP